MIIGTSVDFCLTQWCQLCMFLCLGSGPLALPAWFMSGPALLSLLEMQVPAATQSRVLKPSHVFQNVLLFHVACYIVLLYRARSNIFIHSRSGHSHRFICSSSSHDFLGCHPFIALGHIPPPPFFQILHSVAAILYPFLVRRPPFDLWSGPYIKIKQ